MSRTYRDRKPSRDRRPAPSACNTVPVLTHRFGCRCAVCRDIRAMLRATPGTSDVGMMGKALDHVVADLLPVTARPRAQR